MLVAQRGEALGDRMRNGLHDLQSLGFDSVVLIGSDVPSVPPAYVAAAFDRLQRSPRSVVIGPAEDGGYYLIGMRTIHSQVFDGIEWGSADVLRQTLEVAANNDIDVDLLPVWYDVDSVADLGRLAHEPAGCRHTRAWIAAEASDAMRLRIERENV